jgi:hypothetical protein
MTTVSNTEKTFSEEYVRELRQEAASWRTKCRELEQTMTTKDIQVELEKNGVNAEASWVDLKDGQTVKEAIAEFIEKYPNLKKEDTLPSKEDRPVVRPIGAPKPNSNAPGPKAKTLMGRSLKEIKKDPVARAALRSQYRQLLAQKSNQNFEE